MRFSVLALTVHQLNSAARMAVSFESFVSFMSLSKLPSHELPESLLCPCGLNKLFGQCCQPYLVGKLHAKTPEKLMRSRYSAYALGGYGDYLLATWWPATAQGLSAIDLSEKSLIWQRLDILNKMQQGDTGVVEFKATFLNDAGDQEVMHEVSNFQRSGGRWYYVDGDVN